LGGGKDTHELEPAMQAAVQCGAHDHIRTLDSFYETIISIGVNRRSSGSYDSDIIPKSKYLRHKLKSKNIPFLVKLFAGMENSEVKCRGRKVRWEKKPERKIDTTIPEYSPHKEEDLEENVQSARLSGGQWQRVALARAFMKVKDADLLILDEPSSALDPKAEYEVFKSIMELRKNKSTIFIATPLSTPS